MPWGLTARSTGPLAGGASAPSARGRLAWFVRAPQVMRIAASIFMTAGLAYLGWGVALAISSGVRLGTWLMALVGGALIYQGYALFLSKPGARLAGIISSLALTACFAVVACLLVAPTFPQDPFNVPAEVLPTLGATILVAVAFAAAALLLFLAKHAAP
jgi:hypothetical protein